MLTTATNPFPPVIGVDLLSLLLDKTPQTIFADRSRAPHKIPPACTPPGAKSPRWIVEDVVEWLRQHKEAPAQAPAPVRKPGRPTKVEQVFRRREVEAAAQAIAQ